MANTWRSGNGDAKARSAIWLLLDLRTATQFTCCCSCQRGLRADFFLAVLSIKYQYTGALACWTVVFTPIGTAVGIVLGKIVDKNRAENVSGNGDGITFASAQAKGFVKEEEVDRVSPPI